MIGIVSPPIGKGIRLKKIRINKSNSIKEKNLMMSLRNEMENLIENLEKNVLFNASLGSKELFHSNIIAWFLEQRS